VTSTFVYWLWLLSGGTYLVASRKIQLCEEAGTGAATEVAARTTVLATPDKAIRRGKISASGFSNGGVGRPCGGNTSQIPVAQVVPATDVTPTSR
jgi:hypothetical protein